MFRNKKMLYEDKRYFLLFLSIMSDVALCTLPLFTVLVNIWVRVEPSIGEGIGYYWVLSIGISAINGLLAKGLDIVNIGYYKKTKKKKIDSTIVLQFLILVPAILYWIVAFISFAGSLLGI